MNFSTPRRVIILPGLVPGALRRKAAMLYTPVAPGASNAAGSLMSAAAFCRKVCAYVTEHSTSSVMATQNGHKHIHDGTCVCFKTLCRKSWYWNGVSALRLSPSMTRANVRYMAYPSVVMLPLGYMPLLAFLCKSLASFLLQRGAFRVSVDA